MKYLEALNEAQKSAVLATEGPVLVLAGAGAGKTRTIAHRIVHLVKSGVPPYSILAITFTNKAAREMRERVYGMLAKYSDGAVTSGVTVSTFHALCVVLLRQYAEAAGLKRQFTIYDRADSLKAVKRAIRAIGEDEKQFEPRAVLSAISRAKGDAKTLGVYREETGNAYFPLIVSKVWEQYEKGMRKEGALDFDDLLLEMWRLLQKNKQIREELSRRYRYIHIDEYQDTNKVQYEIVRMLGGDNCNIFCVGDLDQNVYTWRGSTIENILEFEREFPQATTIRLEENYRSTQTIIAISNDIIKKNVNRKEKTLYTKNPEGEKVTLSIGFDERDEAERIVARVDDLIHEGVPHEEIAVLYRANFQSRVLEEAFLSAGIPYRVLGTRFFERKEVKDMLSYLRAALNPNSEPDILRTINTPTRGIGKVTVEKLLAGGREALSGRPRERVDEYYRILNATRNDVENKKPSEVLTALLERSGIGTQLSGKGEEDAERLENIKELVSLAANRYDDDELPRGIERLLEDAALATDQDELDRRTEKKGGVTLMTVHAAKGLEFKHVFIAGLEEDLFPHERTENPYGGAVDDEEERRLFYVALTRAKERVHLSYAQVRTVFGQRLPRLPSEFLLDIDDSFFETEEAVQQPSKVVYLD